MTNPDKRSNAGFWIRLLATWLDCLLIYTVLTLTFYLLYFLSINIYFPFEFTFLVLGILYAIISIAAKGQTFGKWLLGIRVCNNRETNLSALQAIFRESILKIFSAIIFFLGFMWIGFSSAKKGWHDKISGSKVIKDKHPGNRNDIWKYIALVSFIIMAGNYVWQIGSLLYDVKKISIKEQVIDLPFMHRNPSTLIPIDSASDSLCSVWVKSNALTPEQYAINAATAHQVTLFGEMHNYEDNLRFFNSIIDSLYFKSGVRCIAMEAIPSNMNDKLEKLVNGNDYNHELAMEIARSQPWKAWGSKGYWDIPETVWKLNKRLPAESKKMRLIGIDSDWEGPNIAMVNIGGDKRGPTPFWEKFRPSVISDFVKIIYRDEIMARNVEKQIIEKNDKAVVLIGFAHTLQHYGRPVIKNNKILRINPRFGLL